MKINRDCKHCGIRFNARRRNHLYCSDECRHARGNDRHRNKMAPYNAQMKRELRQNQVLDALFRPDTKVTIDEKNFVEYKIYLRNAKSCIRQPDGKLISATFTNYILERVDDKTFQLKKL